MCTPTLGEKNFQKKKRSKTHKGKLVKLEPQRKRENPKARSYKYLISFSLRVRSHFSFVAASPPLRFLLAGEKKLSL